MFKKKNPNIFVKYPDLAVPEIHFKFFKLTCGTDFAQVPLVCNRWPVCWVQVLIPGLPNPLLVFESWSSGLKVPPAQKGLAGEGGRRRDQGGGHLYTHG